MSSLKVMTLIFCYVLKYEVVITRHSQILNFVKMVPISNLGGIFLPYRGMQHLKTIFEKLGLEPTLACIGGGHLGFGLNGPKLVDKP